MWPVLPKVHLCDGSPVWFVSAECFIGRTTFCLLTLQCCQSADDTSESCWCCQIWCQIGGVSLPTTTCVMRTWPRQMPKCCSATPATNMATSLLMPTSMFLVSLSVQSRLFSTITTMLFAVHRLYATSYFTHTASVSIGLLSICPSVCPMSVTCYNNGIMATCETCRSQLFRSSVTLSLRCSGMVDGRKSWWPTAPHMFQLFQFSWHFLKFSWIWEFRVSKTFGIFVEWFLCMVKKHYHW